jgi:hypothetical protein
MAVVAAHPGAMHGNLATMETDFPWSCPSGGDAASATIMQRAGELPRVLAKHLLDGSDPGRQTEALEGTVHILPSSLQAGHSANDSLIKSSRGNPVLAWYWRDKPGSVTG